MTPAPAAKHRLGLLFAAATVALGLAAIALGGPGQGGDCSPTANNTANCLKTAECQEWTARLGYMKCAASRLTQVAGP